ncbi:N-acetyltransferase [Thermobifida halotolerans]|uniref:N-acetyltransferase n=1 Tax=Thermobifida halotolerans TaxID=483545 RepID=A0A399G665_9ACTN|nr:GNAT family N-acetyltransferase [Thermobifida halotolerans]UOE21753.1 N-acetyltransferase [Thermobifida halotolerans]
MDVKVTDVPGNKRYEARGDGGETAGFAEYRTTTDGLVVFTHTEVDPSYKGQGVGGRLVQGALDDVRAHGMRVLPVCSFVRKWIERHPDYADLVYRVEESRVTD